MSWFNLENLRKTSIYITPNFPALQTKRYKVKFFNIILLLFLFAITVSIVTAAILTFTPAKNILLFLENEKLAEHAVEIQSLEEKIIALTGELNEISKINKRLKFAIALSSTDSLDSTANIYDSLRQFQETRPGIDGSIYNVFKKIFNDVQQQTDSSEDLFFIAPSNGIVTKKFLPTYSHLGIDYGVKKNSPVYAAASGIVISADYSLENGYTIILKHGQSFITKYKHLGDVLVEERQSVTAGDLIALSGNTGRNTTGPHLHFEVWKENKAIDPLKLLVE